jgi:hypothetical protein
MPTRLNGKPKSVSEGAGRRGVAGGRGWPHKRDMHGVWGDSFLFLAGMESAFKFMIRGETRDEVVPPARECSGKVRPACTTPLLRGELRSRRERGGPGWELSL